jgi:hypothetical protein
MVDWSNIVPAAFCATAIARLPLPRLEQGAGHVHTEHEGRTAAVVQIEHPIRFHAKAMRHPAAATVERHVRQLNVGDQHVDVGDGVLAVAFDEARGCPFHHVDGRLVFGHVVAELRRPEHHVVPQLIGFGEPGVVVGADRLPGQIRRNVEQADGHVGPHLIQAGVTGKPL